MERMAKKKKTKNKKPKKKKEKKKGKNWKKKFKESKSKSKKNQQQQLKTVEKNWKKNAKTYKKRKKKKIQKKLYWKWKKKDKNCQPIYTVATFLPIQTGCSKMYVVWQNWKDKVKNQLIMVLFYTQFSRYNQIKGALDKSNIYLFISSSINDCKSN